MMFTSLPGIKIRLLAYSMDLSSQMPKAASNLSIISLSGF